MNGIDMVNEFAKLYNINESQLLAYKTFQGNAYQIMVVTNYKGKEYSYVFGYGEDEQKRDRIFSEKINFDWAKEVF